MTKRLRRVAANSDSHRNQFSSQGLTDKDIPFVFSPIPIIVVFFVFPGDKSWQQVIDGEGNHADQIENLGY